VGGIKNASFSGDADNVDFFGGEFRLFSPICPFFSGDIIC